jgi:hypothetical protein
MLSRIRRKRKHHVCDYVSCLTQVWRELLLKENNHHSMELGCKLICLPGTSRLFSALLYSNTVRNTLAVFQLQQLSFSSATECQFSMSFPCHLSISQRSSLTPLYSSLMLTSRRRRSNDAPCSTRSSTNWTESCRRASIRALSS